MQAAKSTHVHVISQIWAMMAQMRKINRHISAPDKFLPQTRVVCATNYVECHPPDHLSKSIECPRVAIGIEIPRQ